MIQTRIDSDETISNTDPGQFIYLRYRNSDGEPSKRTILALAYDDEEGLVHGLDLEHFSDQNLINTAREIADQSQDEYDFEQLLEEENEISLPDVLDREMESWYETEYSADRYKENPYRTFREDRIEIYKEARVTVQ